MAEKKVIELEVNSNLGNLKQQLKQAQVEVQTLSEKFGATSKQAVEAAKAAAILKDKIGDAKALTEAFNPDAKFKAVAGSLTGVAGGFSVVTGAMGAFGKQSEEVEKALLKVQSVMAITSGAQALGESIDSFKQLGAVIKANSVYQGIYNFVTTGSIKSIAQQTAAKLSDTTATVAQGTAMTATTTATVGATAASKALRLALIATGVGALIVGVTLLVQKISAFSEAQRINKKINQESVVSIVSELSAADKLSKVLKNESLTRQEKNIRVREFQKQYPNLLSNINTEKNSIEEINKALTLNIQLLKLQAKQKALAALREEEYKKQLIAETNTVEDNAGIMVKAFNLIKNTTALGSLVDDSIAVNAIGEANKKSAISEAETRIAALDKTEAALEKEMEALKASGAVTEDVTAKNKETADKAAAAAEKRAEAIKANAEKRAAEIEEARVKEAEAIKLHNENLTNFYDAIETERQSKITNDKEKEEQELANKYEKLYELADKAGKSTKDLQEQQAKDNQAITKKYNDLEKVEKDEKDKLEKERLAKDKAYLEELTLSESELRIAKLTSQYEADQLLYKDNKEILKALDIKYAKDKEVLEEQDVVRQKTNNEKKIQMAMDGLSIINDLFQMNAGKSEKDARRAFKAQKAFNLASALTNTYLAVTAALANKKELFPGQRFIEAGLAGAAGAVQVAKIAKTQFEGGSSSADTGGGGGGATAPTMSAPQFNVVGQSGVNQLASLNQQPIQAYVVSGQVTSQQALDRNRLENATLGG
jgi:hypothetical protein